MHIWRANFRSWITSRPHEWNSRRISHSRPMDELLIRRGYTTSQFVEEVQEEYHAIVRLFRSVGRHQRDDVFAVRCWIITSRSAKTYDFSRPNARLIRQEPIPARVIRNSHKLFCPIKLPEKQ